MNSTTRVRKVLIVDDSPTIRQILRAKIESDARLRVVGEAGDPYEAREKIKVLNPDVLTLDVEMPRMNGLDFLGKLMRLRPMPVVMVSAETHKGSVAALEALSLGAVECIGKPRLDHVGEAFWNLGDLLVAATDARLQSLGRARNKPVPGFEWNGKMVVIGSSTGGVDALERILGEFPANCPPTLITQHMPESFLVSFANRLSQQILPQLELAHENAPLRQGQIYLAPGGPSHLTLKPERSACCHLLVDEKCNGHRPSVDVLFNSALPHAERCVAVMLTGMGRDGARGMLELRHHGARCIAQDEASSVVFGMPRAALELGAAEQAVPLDRIASEVLGLAGRSVPTLAGAGGNANA